MDLLKNSFKEKADKMGAEIKEMLKEHGNKKIGEIATVITPSGKIEFEIKSICQYQD